MKIWNKSAYQVDYVPRKTIPNRHLNVAAFQYPAASLSIVQKKSQNLYPLLDCSHSSKEAWTVYLVGVMSWRSKYIFRTPWVMYILDYPTIDLSIFQLYDVIMKDPLSETVEHSWKWDLKNIRVKWRNSLYEHHFINAEHATKIQCNGTIINKARKQKNKKMQNSKTAKKKEASKENSEKIVTWWLCKLSH